MGKNNKKKSSGNRNSKKDERLDLSYDSAFGWVCLITAVFAMIVMILVAHPIRVFGKAAAPSSETAQTEETETLDETITSDSPAYYADIAVEGYGTITVALDAQAAPKTVENFVSLAQSGFYDGLTFHRIIDGFMMQGGDPTGNGTGGSDQTIEGEFSANGWDNPLSHTRGAISMARAEDYNSASSQFFICQEDCAASLDGLYACFGYVTEGMEYVDEICADARPIDDNGSIIEGEQPIITSIVIRTA